MTDIKKQIEKILLELKLTGYDRRKIEKELSKSDFYIDQILSRGGNKKFLHELQRFQKSTLKKESDLIKEVRENKALIDLLVMEVIKLRAKVFEIPIKAAEQQFRQDVDLALSAMEREEQV